MTEDSDKTGPLSQLTVQLRLAAQGDRDAQGEVFRAVEPEIRRIASAYLRRESNAQSMQTTMLVDDAFLKFLGSPKGNQIADKLHFYRLIANYVRQLLIDAARARNAKKRGSGETPISLEEQHAGTMGDAELEVRKLELLEKLQQSKPPAVDVFQMREFIGMEFEEIAKLLEISLDEVKGLHRFASAWVLRELTNGNG